MRHNLDLRKIKKRSSYATKEVGKLLGVHAGTVLRWVREGLRPAEGTRHPFYFNGDELLIFLKERQSRQRCTLGPDEFYCVRCKRPRKGLPGSVKIIKTGKKIRGGKFLGRITGTCEECSGPLNRWSSYM
jgi:hypothetical protein